MGWKLINTSSGEEKAIIINVAETPKKIQYDAHDPIFNNPNIGQGAYIINGKLVNKAISEWFNLPYNPL